MTHASKTMMALVGVGGLLLATSRCGPDVLVGVSGLEIVPDSAEAGQLVSFTFKLTVVPAQGFTLIARIDGNEQTRLVLYAAEDGPFTIDIGDAADLIAAYGLGTHEGAVEVRLDEGARTATGVRTFVLRTPPPPLAGAE